MSWQLSVSHKTTYHYESDVVASFNEVRMTPLNSSSQRLIHHALIVDPSTPVHAYVDYWGSTVEMFDVQTPHTVLTVTSENVVEMQAPREHRTDCTWTDLKDPHVLDQWCEYLTFSDLVDHLPDAPNLATHSTPHEAIQASVAIIGTHITYTSGSTSVHSPASEAWTRRAGVCQDFTHAALSMLRSAGIPARYVSGYLYVRDGEVGEKVVGESHSWVEAWAGEWIPIDPTNGRPVGQSHVIVARARDYNDVSPLSGIFSGGASRQIDVEVVLTRQA